MTEIERGEEPKSLETDRCSDGSESGSIRGLDEARLATSVPASRVDAGVTDSDAPSKIDMGSQRQSMSATERDVPVSDAPPLPPVKPISVAGSLHASDPAESSPRSTISQDCPVVTRVSAVPQTQAVSAHQPPPPASGSRIASLTPGSSPPAQGSMPPPPTGIPAPPAVSPSTLHRGGRGRRGARTARYRGTGYALTGTAAEGHVGDGFVGGGAYSRGALSGGGLQLNSLPNGHLRDGDRPGSQPKRASLVVPISVLIAVTTLLLVMVAVAQSLARSEFDHAGHSLATATPEEWDPVLEPFVEFVMTNRELVFVHPVKVEFRDIERSLASDAASSLSDFDAETIAYFDAWGRVTTILGLTEPGVDPFSAQSSVQAEGAAAFYNLESETIVLPTGGGGVDLQLSIVHELTHALQHQNGLFEGSAQTADQGTMGLALTEGDATRIENLWYDQLSDADKSTLWDQSAEVQTDQVDLANYYFVAFAAPYILGEPAVDVLLAQGGHERLDTELAEARFSTELLIDPFSASPYPLMLNKLDSLSHVPDKKAHELTGNLGPLMLYQTLAPGIGPASAVAALQGYDADEFSSWADDENTCLELQITFGTPTDAREFAELALPIFGQPTSLEEGSLALATRHYRLCDSEQRGDPQDQTLDLLYPVAFNSHLANVLLSSGYDSKPARCAAAEVAFGLDLSVGQGLDFSVLTDRAFQVADSELCT